MNNLAFDTLANEYMYFVVGNTIDMGQSAEKPVTWERVRQLAHLTFTVSKKQLKHPDHPDRKIESWGIFRDDTGEFLANVGRIYLPLQFEYAFTFVDALIGEAFGSHYESAGALGRGNQFWTLARVPAADFFINGTEDRNLAHVLFTSSHDGTIATTARLSYTNALNMTTLQSELRVGRGAMLRIKHTTNSDKKMAAVKNLMDQVVLCSQDIEAKLNILAEREMTKDSLVSILDRVFPDNQGTHHQNILNRIIDLFESNNGDKVPQIKNSAYSLLGAISQYADHEKSVRVSKSKKGMTEGMVRAESAIFGSGNSLKEFAFDVILEETAGNPKKAVS